MTDGTPLDRTLLMTVAAARAATGVVALVAPATVRLATGGGAVDDRTQAFVRMVGARDVVVGVGLLANSSRPRVRRVLATAGAAADLADCFSSLWVAATTERQPRARWLALAGTGALSAAVGAFALAAERRRTR